MSVRNDAAQLQEGETKIINGEKEVGLLAYEFIDRAKNSYICALADKRIPKDAAPAIQYTKELMKKNPEFKMQLIVDLQKENMDYYRAIMETGVDLRHIEGNKVTFAISKTEYLAAPLNAVEEQIATGAQVPSEIVWSTRQDIVSQFDQVFRLMWQSAIKAPARLKELEEGIEPDETIVIEDMEKVYAIGKKMNDECKEEALILLASDRAIVRNEAQFRAFAKRQQEYGFPVKILTPSDNQAARQILPNAQWRKMEKPINVTILIYDRSRMFITQYSNSEASTTEEAVSTNIYSTSRGTIAGIASVFNSLWEETELRQKEIASRMQAQLLQDVLTHDIRNYNQVSKTGTEILIERLEGDPEYQRIAKSVLEAVDGSTALVDKAKKLGRVISEQGNVKLTNVDVIDSIDRSLLLVKKMYPEKRIRESRKVSGSNLKVMADELLDDVFVNLFSNSAKHSREKDVTIDIVIEEQEEKGSYLQVKVKDGGPGIPAEQRASIFERYSKGKKGSGVGLSIVHAIVVGRYGGKVSVDDAQGHSKGAIFSLVLKQA